jgi:Pyruvate/2-oxoacid:ferredoxin oxidoreductase gamma subunit
VEREVLLTGIGGQGIQLMAKILAEAASREGKNVMLFGIYGGMIRGGPSDSTVVIAPGEISSPPILDEAWALVAMHPTSLPTLLPKIRSGGVVVANTTLVVQPIDRRDVTVVEVAATRLAEEAGRIVGASFVALGAFVEATAVVSPDALLEAMRAQIPPHRQALLAFNEKCFALGRSSVARSAAAELAG